MTRSQPGHATAGSGDGGQDYGVRIEAEHFVARIECSGGKVVVAAPIVKYMLGWTVKEAAQYTRKKKWKTEVMK
jgi:hypothetical protein